jgi:hypothetical protein
MASEKRDKPGIGHYDRSSGARRAIPRRDHMSPRPYIRIVRQPVR